LENKLGEDQMANTLVVVSKVKALAKIGGLRTSSEFCEALSEQVGTIIIEAAKSAKSDGRGTIKARDLPEVTFGDSE
jgi:histone H3/H4